MSRINTNVSSLIAQKTLARSNAELQTSLDRLSTGLRINSGKDDPAGLIASENLRRDITASERAIKNTEQANQLIATADSALSQVSGLLNDIRGLVSEAANTGALSDEQIAANQLQIDSSLEAIDRIAQTTTFQGKKLLDGSLDFITSFTTGESSVSDFRIDQANLGATGELAVNIDVSAAATRASITNGSIPYTVGNSATGTLTFADVTTPAVQSTGTLTLATTVADIDIEAVAGEAADGLAGDDVEIEFVSGATTGALYDAQTGILTVTLATGATVDDAVAAIEATDEFTATLASGTGTDAVDVADIISYTGVLTGGADQVADNDIITIAAAGSGTAFNGTLTFATSNTVTAGDANVTLTNGNITITVNDSDTYDLSDLADLIQTELGDDYEVTLSTNASDGSFDSSADTAVSVNLAGGTADTTTGLQEDVTLEVAGTNGAEVFSFEQGTTAAQIVDAINLVGDAIGLTASVEAGVITFESSNFGSRQFVAVNVLSGGVAFEAGLSSRRAEGTDTQATINGISAVGDGLAISINSSTLDGVFTLEDTVVADDVINLTIDGGGARFQLGPDVVSNQQARIGIRSLNTAKLGGVSGKLYELRSGGDKALDGDITGAAKVVDEVINEVVQLRGRLGAFQRTTLETNITTLSDTLTNLTEAESSIRDADFAAESARLTRAQILVQSGTSVLGIANSNPQNVLSLLRQ